MTAAGCWAETLSHHAEHVLTRADVERSVRVEQTGSSRFGIMLRLEATDCQLGVLPLRIHNRPSKSFSEHSQIAEIERGFDSRLSNASANMDRPGN